MNQSKTAVIAVGILLIGWLGWLAYLASTKSNPIVVSRSQVMAASNFVVAEIEVESGRPKREVSVVEDLKPDQKKLEGKIRVVNLTEARVHGGFRPGKYLLPLTARGDGTFELTLQPRSPGQEAIDYQHVRPWAYPWDSVDVQRQFQRLIR